MGNIVFDLFKSVELNKTVELNITKDVFIKVNNPDQLDTAEVEAEDFFPFALGEFDADTLVTPAPSGSTSPELSSLPSYSSKSKLGEMLLLEQGQAQHFNLGEVNWLITENRCHFGNNVSGIFSIVIGEDLKSRASDICRPKISPHST